MNFYYFYLYSDDRSPYIIIGVGLLLGLLLIGEVLTFFTIPTLSFEGFRAGVITSLPFIIGLIYGGYWLSDSELSSDRYPRIIGWFGFGLAGFSLIIVGITLSMRSMTVLYLGSTIRWAASLGGAGGLAIGIFEARAIERALEAERLHFQQQATERERDRLEEFARIVSHDLRNPLNIAQGRLQLAQQECDTEHHDAIESALDRMGSIITDTLILAREGQAVGEVENVDLVDLARECWNIVETGNATLQIGDIDMIEADRNRLQHVFENLFRNAVEHGGDDVAVRIGQLTDETGFYVEDDGTGIPEDHRDEVFEGGYSTTAEGTGFGLNIVKGIVEAHGWQITVTESDDGGARFVITGDEMEPKLFDSDRVATTVA